MEYNVNPNDPNVSTTVNHGNKKDWDLDKVFEFPYTPENLFKTLQIVDGLKRKYPNDDIISNRGLFIIIVVKLMQTFMG